MKRASVILLGFMTSCAVAVEPPDISGQTTPCGYQRIEGVITSIDAEAMQLVVGETPVRLSADTTIRAGRSPLPLVLADLHIGETVAIVGAVENETLSAEQVNVKYSGRGRGLAGGKEWRHWRSGRHGMERGLGRGWGVGGRQGMERGFCRGWGASARPQRRAWGADVDANGSEAGRTGWQRRPCWGRRANAPGAGTFVSPKGRQGPGPNPTPCEGYARIEGTITSIDVEARQLLVGEKTVSVTDTTVVKMGRTLVDFSDLQVGQTVSVCGRPSEVADGALDASRLNIKYRGRKP